MKYQLNTKLFFLFFNSNYCLVRLCQMSYENAERKRDWIKNSFKDRMLNTIFKKPSSDRIQYEFHNYTFC